MLNTTCSSGHSGEERKPKPLPLLPRRRLVRTESDCIYKRVRPTTDTQHPEDGFALCCTRKTNTKSFKWITFPWIPQRPLLVRLCISHLSLIFPQFTIKTVLSTHQRIEAWWFISDHGKRYSFFAPDKNSRAETNSLQQLEMFEGQVFYQWSLGRHLSQPIHAWK